MQVLIFSNFSSFQFIRSWIKEPKSRSIKGNNTGHNGEKCILVTVSVHKAINLSSEIKQDPDVRISAIKKGEEYKLIIQEIKIDG